MWTGWHGLQYGWGWFFACLTESQRVFFIRKNALAQIQLHKVTWHKTKCIRSEWKQSSTPRRLDSKQMCLFCGLYESLWRTSGTLVERSCVRAPGQLGRKPLALKPSSFCLLRCVICCFLPPEEFESIWTSSLELMCHNSMLLTRLLHKALPVITKQSFLTSRISIESAVRIPAAS